MHLSQTGRMRSFLLGLAMAGLAAGAPAQPLDLAFSQFFQQPIGPRGLEPTPVLRAAAGQQVRLTGFMVQRERPVAGQFLLTPRPVTMAEHADGEADDLPAQTVTVLLALGQEKRFVNHQAGPVTLTGRLELGPAETEPGRVSWLRLILAPEALAAASVAPESHSH